MEVIKCLICKGNTKLYLKSDDHEIYKCSKCGFGITLNTKLQKGDYHRDEEYIEEEGLFKNIFQKRVEIISQFKKKGRVLEVGCSTGLLLSQLKERGWEVFGVEPSKKSAEVAQKRGIEAIVDSFENIKINQKFDLVIFNHVLEHLSDPEGVLNQSKNLLDDKGLLLISLPNFDSVNPILLPEEHLWHFTPTSMRMLLEKEGFILLYFKTYSNIWDYGDPLLGIWTSLKSLKKRFFVELLLGIPTYILSKIGKGSGMIIVARKN